jgi:hypothetical protein
MSIVASRITSTGTLFISGEFDEVTTSTLRITTTTQYAAYFDEVTYSSTSPAIKNLLTNTEQFELWANSLNIVTTNATTAPNGKLTADRIQANNSGYTALLNINTVGGASYTFSLYVKSVSGTSGTWAVNYYNDAHNRSTVPITGEWTRQYITFTGTGGLVNVYAADNRSLLASITDAYVWGAQLERGTEPTIYQGIAAANTLVNPGFAKRESSDGTIYLTGSFDEVTGMIVTNELAGYWDAGKLESYVPGNTKLTDLSGSTKDGSPTGPVTYSPSNGGYLSFSGASFYDCPLGFTYSTTPLVDRTIAAWYRCTSASAQLQGIIVIFNGNDNTQFEINLTAAGTAISVATNQGSGTAGVAVSLNTWYYVVGTESHSGGIRTLRLYLNGSLVATRSDSLAAYSFTADRVRLGCQKSGFPRTLLGDISNAQFYTKALSAEEVANNFEALRDRFGI